MNRYNKHLAVELLDQMDYVHIKLSVVKSLSKKALPNYSPTNKMDSLKAICVSVNHTLWIF